MVLDENRSLIAIQGPKSSQILNDVVDGVKDLNFMSGNWFFRAAETAPIPVVGPQSSITG